MFWKVAQRPGVVSRESGNLLRKRARRSALCPGGGKTSSENVTQKVRRRVPAVRAQSCRFCLRSLCPASVSCLQKTRFFQRAGAFSLQAAGPTCAGRRFAPGVKRGRSRTSSASVQYAGTCRDGGAVRAMLYSREKFPESLIKSFRKGKGRTGGGGQPFFKRVSLSPRHILIFFP